MIADQKVIVRNIKVVLTGGQVYVTINRTGSTKSERDAGRKPQFAEENNDA